MPAPQRRTPTLYYATTIIIILLLLVFYLGNTNKGGEAVMEETQKEYEAQLPPRVIVIPGNCTEPKNAKGPKREISDDAAYAAIREIGEIAKDGGTKNCQITTYGSGNGVHELCTIEVNPEAPCKFLSFGISDDYSFDTGLADQVNCKGMGFDPTQNHKSKVHDRVWFVAVGANSLMKDNPPDWILSSVPSIAKMVQWDHLDVLKMDCEGCEYALARDILNEDPDFLKRVDQAAFEFHVSKWWLTDDEALLNLGKLFVLLKEAGMECISADLSWCNPVHEAVGCHPKLLELGYPCTNGHMCQNFLFAKTSFDTRKK